jgi:hypothetical protein
MYLVLKRYTCSVKENLRVHNEEVCEMGKLNAHASIINAGIEVILGILNGVR